MKVMIVDDSPAMREMIKQSLKYSVDYFCEASDGGKAIEMYPKCRPDWVLMDIAMENVDGITATTTIMKQFPDARIVIVTQYKEPRLAEAAKKAGASGFVLKDELSTLPTVICRVE